MYCTFAGGCGLRRFGRFCQKAQLGAPRVPPDVYYVVFCFGQQRAYRDSELCNVYRHAKGHGVCSRECLF